MSEFTDWYPVDNPTEGGNGGEHWIDVPNIALDDVSFSFADAPAGTWTIDQTYIIALRGNPAIDALIPDNSTFDSVEVKMYYELPSSISPITGINVRTSDSPFVISNPQTIATIPGPTGLATIDYDAAVDDIEGRAIAQGGGITNIFCNYAIVGTPSPWQLNWRFAEMRIEFTRAPYTPRTAFIAMF
jgi:hypothetical protein